MLAGLIASLLFVGDSITRADPELQAWVESGFVERLGGENRGAPGSTTQDWVRNFSSWAEPYLEPNQTVHVLLGTNDASLAAIAPDHYAAVLELLIRKLSGEGRRVVVSAPYRIALGGGANRLLAGYARQIDAIWAAGLAERGVSLWDDPPELHDGVHPTQAGHDHIAALLRPVLVSELPVGAAEDGPEPTEAR